MRHAATARFDTITDSNGVTVFEIYPVPPSWNFLGAAVLLGGLFGAPALAVALDPSRRDAWSLGATVCGVLILGLAVLAGHQALAGRRRHRIRASAVGLEVRSGSYPWQDIIGIEVLSPPRNRFAPPAPDQPAMVSDAVRGSHSLGASIARQQQAGAASIALHLRGQGKPVPLATGLDMATAERLRQTLLSLAPAYGGPAA